MVSKVATEGKDGNYDVTYVASSVPPEDNVAEFLNRLTSYNHMMTLNEQLVKHQLRSKFLFEALSTLQSKKLKENKGLKQKALLMSSLAVIEALLNPNHPCVKQLNISADNFQNSLRLCFVRDSHPAQGTKDIPVSLLKLIDELLTEHLDVTLPQNAELVSKAVNLLKIVAEFVTVKREEEAKEEEKLAEAALVDQQMQESEESEENENDGEEEEGNEEDEEIHDDEDDEGEDDDDVGEPEGVQEEADEIQAPVEDDYDQEIIDEDEELDEDDVNALVIRDHPRRGAGAIHDIINLGAQGGQHDIHHRHAYMFGRPRDRPLPQQHSVDWTQEEAEVQRILGNLRNNAPEQAAAGANPRSHVERYIIEREFGMFGAPPQREQPEAVNKKGVIQQTYEELKVENDNELYNQVFNIQEELDREVQALGGVYNN